MGKIKSDEIIKRKFDRYEDPCMNDELEDAVCENYQESQKEEDDLYINETSILIRQKIFEYVHNGGYPLCEYLKINNIENYITYLLS